MFQNLDSFKSIPQAFCSAVDKSPDSPLYVQAVLPEVRGRREKNVVSRQSAAERVDSVTVWLKRQGIVPGDKVAVLSSTRPEWVIADLAIMAAGAVSVSIYHTLPPTDVGFILHDSGAKFVFVENQEQYEKVHSLLTGPIHIPATEDTPAAQVALQIEQLIAFDKCVATGEGTVVPTPLEEICSTIKLEASERQRLRTEVEKIARTQLAALVYTSGTTGPPKGVMQTHGNHLANVRQAGQAGMYRDGSKIFLLLPLAHSFAKLMAYIGACTTVTIFYAALTSTRSSKADPASITRDMAESGAGVFPLVPRLLEKMKEGVERRGRQSGLSSWLLRWSLAHLSKSRSQSGNLLTPLAKLVAGGVRRRLFGPEFEYVISGGAKLPPEIGYFFQGLGVQVLEGYGLTETCVATNVNRQRANRIGTVGPVLADDIELMCMLDGEVCFRGPNVTSGYYNRPSATAAAWDSAGWFHSGDLGKVDEAGFLTLTGRKKEIIVLSNGKKVSPEAVEHALKSSSLITQAIVFGSDHPHCVALLVLDKHALVELLPGYDGDLQSAPVRKVVSGLVQDANSRLANFEAVKDFAILAEEFTIDNGLLTPSFKVKRNVVEERYKAQISQLFAKIG